MDEISLKKNIAESVSCSQFYIYQGDVMLVALFVKHKSDQFTHEI